MTEIIDISTRTSIRTPIGSNYISTFLKDVLLDMIDAEDALVFIKGKDGSIEMYRTDNIDIKDRSYMLQLMQSDILDEITPTYDVNLEPDL